MDPIYYVFSRATGAFMGSGTVFFDDETFGCTEMPCACDTKTEQAHWDGNGWIVTPL